jgi:hypothetical protein
MTEYLINIMMIYFNEYISLFKIYIYIIIVASRE